MKEKNITIDYLKAFAIILVVLGHSLGYYNENIDSLSISIKTVYLIIYSVHVPLFFFLAGFLCHPQGKKEFYRKKIKRIIIPFITFTILKLIYGFVIQPSLLHGNSLYEQITQAIFGDYYWFSYSMFTMYLISPYFCAKANKTKRLIYFILFLLIINIFISLMKISIIPNYFQILRTIKFLPFFLAGILFQDKKQYFIDLYKKYKIALLTIAIIITSTIIIIATGKIQLDNTIRMYIYAFPLMIILYCLSKIIKNKNVCMLIIAKYSYQIMLFDSFYKIILYKFSKYIPIHNISLAFIIALIDILLASISCIIIEKMPYINILFGLQKNIISNKNLSS